MSRTAGQLDRHAWARRLLGVLDLTRLADDTDEHPVRALCARALDAPVQPAAVCVYRQFVPAARGVLGAPGRVRVATVANFPDGAADPRLAALECEQALTAGADEVDVVFPWRALIDGDESVGADLVSACRDACGTRTLKVIVEAGMLERPRQLRRAAEIAINAGADFVKTSTGKTAAGASLQAARVLLETIRASGRPTGFKVAGGVRTPDAARGYAELVCAMLGSDALTPRRFRIGASGLLDGLVAELREDSQ